MTMRLHFVSAAAAVILCLIPCRSTARNGLALKADSSKKCAICHYKWVPTFYLEKRSTPIANAHDKALEMFSSEVCLSCHDGSVRDSRNTICNDPGHQVGRVPSQRISIPPEFPLDERGALKCTTCHSPHAVIHESESMVEYFLRAQNENSAICKRCHAQKTSGPSGGNHPIDVPVRIKAPLITEAGGKFGSSPQHFIICETCHKAHGGVNSQRLVLPVESQRSMSVLCEACHTRNALRPGASAGRERSHPVDVRPDKGVHIPASWSNGEKTFVGHKGEIVCRTCHKPHQAGPEFLLASPEGREALCVQCHGAGDPLAALPAAGTRNDTGEAQSIPWPCGSCHRVHKNHAVQGNTAALWEEGGPGARRNLERFFVTPHFWLHPRTFFGSAFFIEDDDTAAEDEILLVRKPGVFSDDEAIVCATCHDVGGLDIEEGAHISFIATDNETTAFLRPHIAGKFCKSCHGEQALVRFLYFHEKW